MTGGRIPDRPAWWPEGEPWPPRHWPPGHGPGPWGARRGPWGSGPWGSGPWGPGPWAHRRPFRRGFVWRIGFGLLVLLVLFVGAATLAIILIGDLLGVVGLSQDVGLGAAVVLVLGILGLVRLGRRMTGAAAPLDDLIDAAGRVEAGERGVRVEERGPREVRSLGRAFNAMSERLEADETARRTLLADISHELRTPLTVIDGTVEGIVDHVYPPDDVHLGRIADATRTLTRLIDDLRTLALADRGALELDREPVDLVTLANETVAALAASIGPDRRVAVDAPPTVAPVEADPVRIREILTNLLANALRHTPAGGSVTIEIRDEEAPRDGVSVAVTDTGPGIDPAVLPRVFDRFVKTPDSPGSGLGLAIARDLVRAHGGTIEADSPPSGGTTIRLSLPR